MHGPATARCTRSAALANPRALAAEQASVEALLDQPYLAGPLRVHDCAPVTDGAAVVILPAGHRAPELYERPAWITGFEHRIDSGQADVALGHATRGPALQQNLVCVLEAR